MTDHSPVPHVPKASEAMRLLRLLKRNEQRERTIAVIVIGLSAACWINAALYHYKTGQHVLMALDVLCPPFGIGFGALRLSGLL